MSFPVLSLLPPLKLCRQSVLNSCKCYTNYRKKNKNKKNTKKTPKTKTKQRSKIKMYCTPKVKKPGN